MATLFSFMEICSLGINERHVSRMLSFQLLRGHRIQSRRTRSSNMLGSFKWFSRHIHRFPWKMIDEVNTCIESRKLGFGRFEPDGTHGEIDFHVTRLLNDHNLALDCERFPSIVLGNSPLTELYTGGSGTMGLYKSVDSRKYFDGWPSIGSNMSNKTSSTHVGKAGHVLDTSPVKILADKQGLDGSYTEHSVASGGLPFNWSSSIEESLDISIRCLPSMTNSLCSRLENGGFHTVRKLLNHFPRTYADLQNARDAIEDGQYLILVGIVSSSKSIKAGSSLSFLEVIVACELSKNGQDPVHEDESFQGSTKIIYLHLKKFFRGIRFTCKPFLEKLRSTYNDGDRIYITGKVKKMRAEDHFEMREYTVDKLEKIGEPDVHMDQRPYPLYPSKAGIKPGFLRDVISRSLKLLPANIDPLPPDILKEFNLLNLRDTYIGIHCPRSIDEADTARRRLIFDEFFYLQLARLYQMLEALGSWSEKEGLLEKYRNQRINTIAMEDWSDFTKNFLKALPYSLTATQLNAVSEIIWDLRRPVPMNRLLQGEVGSGKTIIAFLACVEVMACGFQAAFMVPTELLAIQHYEQFIYYMDNLHADQQKPSVALLTGSTSTKQSRSICQGLLTGDVSMVIGTHSLIAEKIDFSALRIAVIDEQHRFGVIQRGRFNSKLYSGSTSSNATNFVKSFSEKVSMAPHVLAMSATPIPRSLALALYGDMSLTQITGTLPGRLPVETYALEGDENGFEKVYQMMSDELVGGGKIYLVYPVIEESEQLPQLHAAAKELESISAKFEGYQCGLLHGRMKSEEKDETLRQFRSGNTKILLSTLVIEIGIDVPDASMMVVMNAERFGMAQLHQLRGRVGRGAKKSRCILLASTSSALGRLKVLEKSSDGFHLAQVDLMLRGPGDLLGKKQSGHLPDFPIARLEIDGNILQEAHLAALKVLSCSNDLEKFPRLKADLSMRQPLCLLGD